MGILLFSYWLYDSQKKCECCGDSFRPTPQNRDKQRYCDKPECRKVSKKASQEKWLAKYPDWWKHSSHVFRSQQWRLRHPGYWRRKKEVQSSSVPIALQENSISQIIDNNQDVKTQKTPPERTQSALQDNRMSQLFDSVLFVGFLSVLTGCALQEDIASQVSIMREKGAQILGQGALIDLFNPKKSHNTHHETDPHSRSFKDPPVACSL